MEWEKMEAFAEYVEQCLRLRLPLHLKSSTQIGHRSILDSKPLPKFGKIPRLGELASEAEKLTLEVV